MARGTRYPSGVSLSGGYPVGYTAENYKLSGGTAAWAGTTLGITHGMKTLLGFAAGRYMASAVSTIEVVISTPNITTNGVSLTFQAMTDANGATMAISGGTVYWTAFGV